MIDCATKKGQGDRRSGQVLLTCKAGTVDIMDSVVRNQKLFLPPHKNSPSVPIIDRQPWSPSLVFDVAKGREAGPVNEILVFTGAPVLRQKAISTANDFGVKVSRELRPVVGEAADTQISAKKGSGEINVLGARRGR